MLSGIPSGARVFIDANIFIYHFLGIKDSCSIFLARVEARQIQGFTSVVVLSEVWHRLMVAEAIETYQLSPNKTVSYLKNHPECVRTLSRCAQAVGSIPKMNIKIVGLSASIFNMAFEISKESGFLTNDSLNLTIMCQHRLKHIATNDSDFDHIKNIKIWKPV